MAKRPPLPTRRPRERAFLVGAEIHGQRQHLTLTDSMTELGLLADTAGLDVVGSLTQKLERPHVETYIGPGKVEELKALAEETLTDVVVFDEELSPRHQRELELALENKILVLDRRCSSQSQRRLLEFPGLPPNPSLHIAGRTNEVVLQFHLGQAAIARVAQAMSPDQLALRAFDGVAMFHALLESVGLLLLAPGLQHGVMLSHQHRAVSLTLGDALSAQRASRDTGC